MRCVESTQREYQCERHGLIKTKKAHPHGKPRLLALGRQDRNAGWGFQYPWTWAGTHTVTIRQVLQGQSEPPYLDSNGLRGCHLPSIRSGQRAAPLTRAGGGLCVLG